MAYVITEPCIGVKDAACVDVCPVDCIHPTPQSPDFKNATQLYIDPDTCINCCLCETECPVSAIYEDEDVPEKYQKYIQINADYFKKDE